MKLMGSRKTETYVPRIMNVLEEMQYEGNQSS
jgi:hypothetical protein